MALQITTLWYRAPEIFLQWHDYGLPVDMWAFGCVCVEVVAKQIAFRGTSDIHMTLLIFGKFGLPSPSRWGELYKRTRRDLILQLYDKMPASGGMTSWDLGEAREFVGKLIAPSPSERLTVASARDHEFLRVC